MIEEVVEKLSESYHQEKKAKSAKEKYRKEFFAAVTEGFGEEDLAQDLITVDAESEEEARAVTKRRHPKYTVLELREHPELPGKWEVIIEEDPEHKAFSVEVGGELWQRQISVGSPTVDDEKLAAEDPDLFEAVTFVPEPERQMKPLKEIDPVDMAKLEKYLVPGKLTVRLPAPKAVEK